MIWLHVSELSIDRLLAGEVPAEDAAAMRDHARACKACGDRLVEAETVQRDFAAIAPRLAIAVRRRRTAVIASVGAAVTALAAACFLVVAWPGTRDPGARKSFSRGERDSGPRKPFARGDRDAGPRKPFGRGRPPARGEDRGFRDRPRRDEGEPDGRTPRAQNERTEWAARGDRVRNARRPPRGKE